MKGIKLVKLKYNIILGKYILNLTLFFISPKSRIVLMLSQNLDKHITLQQKVLYRELSLNTDV
jgi:hypothetical protein